MEWNLKNSCLWVVGQKELRSESADCESEKTAMGCGVRVSFMNDSAPSKANNSAVTTEWRPSSLHILLTDEDSIKMAAEEEGGDWV